jgi:hypothetical protein
MTELSPRDFLAATIELPEGLSRQTARTLAGCEPPQMDGVDLIKWWALAKARMRYIEADAMLKVRSE